MFRADLDLGAGMGTRRWWRDAGMLAALLGLVWCLSPPLRPLPAIAGAPLAGAEWEEARAQSIAPIAYGATTGRRMGAGALVRPLAETPERPQVELSATLGDADTLARALARAGVGSGEAARVAGLVADQVALDTLKPGTQLALTLGRRPTKFQPRPLEKLAFRAAFDLNLAVTRAGDGLIVDRQPIAIDRSPLHVRGAAGASLYRAVRAAGLPARLVEAYIRTLSSRLSMRDVGEGATFDLVVDRARAATGEEELGDLQLAGLETRGRRIQLVRWGEGETTGFMDASGRPAVQRSTMGMPVAGRITSSYGWRTHPLLGYLRLHKGLDIGAAYGSPIFAALDGVVASAGWAGGYGRFVKLTHGAGYASGYGHMSRIAVRAGQRVARGQVIGYVGSTGLSTGPHLHWEVWRNGRAVNPRSVSVASAPAIPAATLRAIRAKAQRLLAAPVA